MKKTEKKPPKAKNPGGRPRLPDNLRRDKVLDEVRMSQQDKDLIYAAAAKSGKTLTAFVRERLGLT